MPEHNEVRSPAQTLPHISKDLSIAANSVSKAFATIDQKSFAQTLPRISKDMSIAANSMSKAFATIDQVKLSSQLTAAIELPSALKAVASLSSDLRNMRSSLGGQSALSAALESLRSPLFPQMSAVERVLASTRAFESSALQSLRTPDVPYLWFKNTLRSPYYHTPDQLRPPIPLPVKPSIRSDSQVLPDEHIPLSSGETLYWLEKFDALVTDIGLRRACRRLFAHGFYSDAVRMATIYVDNMVRDKSGCVDKYGAKLMWHVFDHDKPILKLNKFETLSEKNEQKGYRQIYAGVMTGIRNPLSHEHDLAYKADVALERLVMANHLMRMLDAATKVDPEASG